jgi:hypothetical protein
MAAVALYDHVPNTPQRELERVVRSWWNGKIVPALKSGRGVIARDDAYALWELLHTVRDNTNIDLRELPRFFKEYPIEHLITHYPAIYEAPENEYRIGLTRKAGEPDLQLAALSRAVEMEMVALDVNAPESQVLQGWLMHDRFMLRGTFGAPYEFRGRIPINPGLPLHLAADQPQSEFRQTARPLKLADDVMVGLFDGVMQMFSKAASRR